jgi:hypothetical protein
VIETGVQATQNYMEGKDVLDVETTASRLEGIERVVGTNYEARSTEARFDRALNYKTR